METDGKISYPQGQPARFKPTYKEWKLFSFSGIESNSLCFKPTYKEWKQMYSWLVRWNIIKVLSLPTRNGNSLMKVHKKVGGKRFKPTYKEWKLLKS